MSAAQTGARVLVVEDEGKLAQLLTDYLQAAGYQTEVLLDPEAIQAAVEAGRVDAILLDLMLPGTSGLEICKAIRKRSQVPILMVTAKVDEVDRLVGLELGADDYICKPFSPREVVARVRAVLRRTQPGRTAELELDANRFSLRYKGREVSLTTIEFALVQALADRPGHILSRDRLMTRMYSDHRIVSDRTIDSHVKKLRQKLAEVWDDVEFIHSVYGAGYRLEVAEICAMPTAAPDAT
ncbi:MAG: two-component system response regulator BaeR [Alteromonadaceae bacterium]|nr:two-component system response regulator BaeR [Alteromonadaceae bacterium]|tara:strand:- start:219 stop:935 length:717 start_codon:yes stop_codon:yes gene_type:complete